MQELTVRSVLPEDKNRIQQIIEGLGVFTREELKVALELVDEALYHAERDEYHVLCAVKNPDTVIGYACFGSIPMTDGRFDLYWIAVDESCGKQGVGRKLLARVEDVVKSRDGRRIYVETSSTPAYAPARFFYERNGYLPACVLSDYYRQGDHKMILMKEL